MLHKHSVLRRFLLLLFMLTSCLLGSAKTKVTREKLPKQEKEHLYQEAQDFLTKHGAKDVNNIHLSMGMITKNLVFMSDWQHRLFVLAARDSAAAYLNNRFLGFSMGATSVRDPNDIGIERLFYYYENTLARMRRGELPREKVVNKADKKAPISSLLKYIKWRQFRFRQMGDGIPDGTLTGCGPTAAAQIMSYYLHPKDCIDWKNTYFNYNSHHCDTNYIMPLMAKIGRSVKAKFGFKGTSSNLRDIREGMIRDWGFSSRMVNIYDEVTEGELLDRVHQNLLKLRPVILSDAGHIFICDGFYGNYYHLNMGWSGNYDGWYRFLTPDANLRGQSYFDGALLDIVPNTQDQTEEVIICSSQAGTLDSLLTAEQRENLTHLKVTGPLNGKDILLLRQMAGYLSRDNITSWHGALSHLDLSEAQIVNDSVYYFSFNAAEYDFRISWDSKNYYFSKMTHQTWLEIKDTRAVHNNHLDIEEIVPDSCYRVHLKTRENVVSPYMFLRCNNLKVIHLPRSTQEIAYYVFHGCPLLETIYSPRRKSLKTVPTSFPKCKIEEYE